MTRTVMCSAVHGGLCLLLGAVALPPAHAAESSARHSAAARDSLAARDLDDVISRLRTHTEANISAESRAFDFAYRDSVSAVYNSTIAADGLSTTLQRHASSPGRRGRGGSSVRTGFTLSPEDGALDYNKVDGFTAATAAYGYVTALGVRSRVGGRLGYAFGSDRGRHDAGIRMSAHDVAVGWSHREVTETFGWTSVHARRLFALAGADELDYLEREGWRAYVESEFLLPMDLSFRLGYRREDELARRVRDFFTVGDPSGLFESNPRATEGEVRAVTLSVRRSRDVDSNLHGGFTAETAGRGLGGDLSYDRIRAAATHVRRLPWADELSIQVAAQASAAPGGAVPVQVLADPVGRAGVRGYPHRSRVGTHGLLARVEYRVERDLLRATRLPILARARLQFVPFVDVGAAWTPAGATELADGTLPESGDWKWAAGLGVRKGLGFGELLSHARLDAALRLDRSGAKPVFYFVLEGEPFD